MNTLAPCRRESLFLALVVATFLACGLAAASEEQTLVQVPGTSVSVAPPYGFESAEQFPGFQRVDTGSSIMITEIPAPFDAVSSGMTEQGLASQGTKLISSKSVRLAERDGLLIFASQEANGIAFRKWLAVFGTDRATVMVVATFPETFATEMSEPLKRAVLSAEWNIETDVGVFDGLSFRIKETTALKITNRMSTMLMLTKRGKPGPVAPNDPLLIVGSSINQVQIDDVEAFAKSRIMQTAKVRDIGNIKGESMTIGHSSGYEITAEAKDADSGDRLVLYQVIVVKGNAYYIVQGLVEASAAEKYVAEFREVATSMSFVE